MRQIDVRALVSKAKLHDLHARDVELLAQRTDLFRDIAKVLGDERQLAKFVLERLEEIVVGTGRPVSVDGSRFVGGNFPAGFEAAKVIETNDVTGFHRPSHAVDPPVVAARFEGLPVIERIAPALAGFAEGIGRNAGHNVG